MQVDLDSADGTTKREVSSEEAREWAATNDCKYIETSAATGLNIVDAFELVARAIHELVRDVRRRHADSCRQVQANKLKRPQRGGSAFPTANAAGSASRCC